MSDLSILGPWPGEASVIVLRLESGVERVVASAGDLGARRAWASVSKMAVALAFGVEVDWELHRLDETIGPRGATLANLLSHSSGLGLEVDSPLSPVGAKRVYSNYGIDLAVGAIVGENPATTWLDGRIFRPFGMHDSALEGRPAAGVVGSTEDLARLAVAWLRHDGVSVVTRDRFITPYMPELEGIVPGFGRFSPCPWGMGPEIRGTKQHWMGDWPPASFGHFGQSGALMLLNADEQIAVVATSEVAFGPWAIATWPAWTSAMRRLALAS